MLSLTIIGWIGAFLLATCGLPQLYKTIKTRDFSGLSLVFILWWLAGEVLTLTYIAYDAFRWPLLFNYGTNIAVCIFILSLFIFWRNKKK